MKANRLEPRRVSTMTSDPLWMCRKPAMEPRLYAKHLAIAKELRSAPWTQLSPTEREQEYVRRMELAMEHVSRESPYEVPTVDISESNVWDEPEDEDEPEVSIEELEERMEEEEQEEQEKRNLPRYAYSA